MKFQTTNIFLKGCISDIDPVLRTTDYWTFPTLNARVFTKDGQGYIMTPMKGNTKHDLQGNLSGSQGEEFSLSPGYIPVGACEYNGVLYIASYNQSSGIGELGTFPSCDWANQIAFGGFNFFTRDYRPLYNYNTGGGREDFKTILFNFDLSRRMTIFPRKDYDDSVNLYICDYHNRNRVINSGFTQDGWLTPRIYTPTCFQTFINQYPTTSTTAKIDLNKITSPGELKFGNYFFYFRYLTHDYNPTDLAAEFGPCQVYSGENFVDPFSEGAIHSIEGGDHNESSGKSITLNLQNLDPTYKYVKLYYSRYYSDGTNDVILHENKEILFNYEITGSSMLLTVSGLETMVDMKDSELLRKYPDDIISRTHCHVDNRYFGANWKSRVRHDQSLADFAQQVYIDFDVKKMWMPSLEESTLGVKNYDKSAANNGYKNYFLTAYNTGYFRTETYPFTIVYEFNDGTLSDAYPTLGIDAINLNANGVANAWNDYFAGVATPTVNTKGIVRFQRNNIMPFYHALSKNINILHPVFHFNRAQSWYLANIADPNNGAAIFIRDNVRAIHICRGERNKNLLYQGFSMATCEPTGNMSQFKYTENHSSFGHQITNAYNTGFPQSVGNPDSSGVSTGNYGQAYNDSKWVEHSAWRQWQKDDGTGYKHTFKLNHHYPYFNAFVPTHFYKKNCMSSGGDDKQKAIVNINFTTRYYMDPGFLALYSFDFLFQRINDVDDAKYWEIQARIIPDMAFSNAGYYHSFSESYRDTDGFRENPMMSPRVYLVDTVGPWGSVINAPGDWLWKPLFGYFGSGKIDFCEKIGEGRFVDSAHLVESRGKFCNLNSELRTDPASASHYIFDEGGVGRENGISTRTAIFAKYIGWYNKETDLSNDTDQTVYNWLNTPGLYNGYFPWSRNPDNCITNFYKHNPYTLTGADFLRTVNTEEILFSIIHEPILFSIIGGSGEQILDVDVYGGDCFIQRTYFKQRYWNGSNFGNSDKDNAYEPVLLDETAADNPENQNYPTGSVHHDEAHFYAFFSHGMIFGTVLESANNTAMRHAGKSNDYYPRNRDAFNFAKLPYNLTGIDSLLLNKGYNRVLSARSFFHYVKNLPSQVVEREVRIRHSGKHTDGSFVDGYRSMEVTAYCDYDNAFGPIMNIFTDNGTLFSVQRDGIQQHYANEQQAKIPSSEGELIIGTGAILAPQTKRLSDFGTQHQWSVVQGVNGCYGVDWKRRVIWAVKTSTTQLGSTSTGAVDLTKTTFISKWLYDLAEDYDHQTDIVNFYDDTPLWGYGINAGYDPKFNNVYFTFLMKGRGAGVTVDKSVTLMYDENLEAFIGQTSFTPSFYARINDDFYSVSRAVSNNSSGYFHLHDVDSVYLMFYNIQYEWQYSILVNGREQEQNASTLTKIFESHDLHGSEKEYAWVEYETEYQKSIVNPFLDLVRFWITPEYLEHHWKIPIFVKTDADTLDFQTNSEMRGTWLKTTFHYFKDTESFVKNISTIYEISKV